MNIKRMLATLGVLAIAGTAAFAQVGARPQIYSDVVPPERGTAEVGLSVDAKLDSPSSFGIGIRYLPYLNRQVQLGGSLDYVNFKDGPDGGWLELRADYNFVPNATSEFAYKRTIPYAGAALGVSFGDYDGSSWGLQGGVKHFITNDVSVFGELRYRDFSKGDNDDFRLLIGLSTFLRK